MCFVREQQVKICNEVLFDMGVAVFWPLYLVDNILCWNVRGLNVPNKQKEVILLCQRENVGLVALL